MQKFWFCWFDFFRPGSQNVNKGKKPLLANEEDKHVNVHNWVLGCLYVNKGLQKYRIAEIGNKKVSLVPKE